MNINQYKCNMKVLTGLFLANDVELDHVSTREGLVDLFDDKNPPIIIHSFIPTRYRFINLQYDRINEPQKRVETLYFEGNDYFELRVFLR